MANWNPNATATKGLEWFPTYAGAQVIGSNQDVVCESIVQSVAQAAPSLRVGLGTIGARKGLYAVEVYDNESAVAAGYAYTFFFPNEDVSRTAGLGGPTWVEDDGTTTNIYDQLGNMYSQANYIRLASPGSDVYTGRFATGTAMTGKRVVSIGILARPLIIGAALMSLGLVIGGVRYTAWSNLNGYDGNQLIFFRWLYNPATGLPWTVADANSFDTTNGFFVDGGMYADQYLALYGLGMSIDYVDENRLAIGVLDDRADGLAANNWNTVTLTTPTGGAWTKDGTGRHLVLIHRVNNRGSITVPYLSDGSDGALRSPPVATGFFPSLDPLYGYVTAMGAPSSRVYPVEFQTTGPTDSVDGQPYHSQIEARVYGAQRAEQEMSDFAATNYGVVRAAVKPNGALTDLEITMHKRSDSSQVGGAFLLTAAAAAALPDAGNGWKVLRAQIGPPSAGLAPATQYYFQLRAPGEAGTGTRYWSVLALDTLNAGNVASFGSTTDRAVVNNVEADRYEIPATIATVPTALTGVSAFTSTQTVTSSVCGATLIPRTTVVWNPSALGGSFARYEIERSEAGGAWSSVARVTAEGLNSFVDYEVSLGLQACYRLRVVRTDGAVSDWSSSVCATKAALGDCVLYLVSNYRPALNMVLDYDPDVSYDFLEADEQVVHAIYGQDDSLAFQPIEQRGTRAIYAVTLAFDGHGTVGTRATVFAGLRALATAAIPYVCILDSLGNRFYGTARVASGDTSWPSRTHTAPLEVTSVRHDFVLSVSA